MKAIIYTRVSTDEQVSSGLGLAAQFKACQRIAEDLSVSEILHFSDAGISGASSIEERPGLTAALLALRRGDTLIVAKRDRIARDQLTTLLVERAVKSKKPKLLSVAGEGTGEEGISGMMQRGMFDLFAQLEREMIRTRTKSALGIKKARGERVGQIPYGYCLSDDGVHLTPTANEQKIIAEVLALRKSGLSIRSIVAAMNEKRIPSRTGNQWQLKQIQNIIVRAR
jgi:DNA invertase Pin-like site-specific DNA recombinase